MGTPDFETRTPDWLGFEEARARILTQAEPVGGETVPVLQAMGQALARALEARVTLPPWDNSAMDGYAVIGADVAEAAPAKPVALRVVRAVHAGESPGPAISSGEAVRIMTGAPVPPGADCVVRVEDTDREADAGTVRIQSARDLGRNVRPAGEDMRAGQRVLEAGATITPGVVAVLSALGHATVEAVKRPTVAILTTGNELRPPDRFDEVISGHGVPESNAPMLAAAVVAASGSAVRQEIVRDDAEALRTRIEAARSADVLVTIGGASMGEADLVKRVLDDMGFRQDFWRVRIRPGSPFAFGWLPREGRDQAVFSLPGNPSSAFVTFELFVRPFLLALGGHRRVLRRTVRGVAAERISAPAELTYFLRVALDDSLPPRVRLTGPQGSGLVSTLGLADGLAVLPEGVSEIAEGEPVDVMLLGDGPGAVGNPAA